MILPTRRFLYLLVAGLLFAVAPAILGDAAVLPWLVVISLLVAGFVLDFILALPRRHIRLEVRAPREVYVGADFQLEIKIDGRKRLPAWVDVYVTLPENLEGAPLQRWRQDDAALPEFSFELRAHRRGQLIVEHFDLRWTGRLGLCEVRKTETHPLTISVVPDLAAVREAALNFARRSEFMSGMKADRILGDGSEFDRMREFVPGMDMRSIDWKASARHRRIMARQYRAERNHQVVMSIDTGRLMGEPLKGIPRIDHAINASLLLAWSCLKTGDRVALHAFADRTIKYTESEGGVRAFPRIRSSTSEIDYSYAETNYTLSLTQLALKLRRRALVVVFTDFADSISAEIMMDNIQILARRHLIIFISMRDPFLDEYMGRAPTSSEDIGRTVIAADLRRERLKVQRRLELAGVHVLDVKPEELSTALVQAYLDIKNRELL